MSWFRRKSAENEYLDGLLQAVHEDAKAAKVKRDKQKSDDEETRGD